MKTKIGLLFLLMSLFLMPACGVTTERMQNAEELAPVTDPGSENLRERTQILIADSLSNRADVFFWAYQLADDGRLIDSWMCQGRPVSSTESIEPNMAVPVGMNGRWRIAVDGHDAYTDEVMGIDTTYGDAVAFLYCITPEGHYEQWPERMNVRVTTNPRVYPDPVLRVDEAQVAKIETARAIIAAGGCVDSNLNEIDCSVVDTNLGIVLQKAAEINTPGSDTITPEGGE